MKAMSRCTFFFIALLVVGIPGAGRAMAEEVIKLGTLATETSGWGRTFKQMGAELLEVSRGELQFRFYFGMDEDALIERLESRQLDAVSLTSAGLGQVLPASFVLQLPMLFSTYEELDCVREALTPRFSQYFGEKGYVFLGWGDLGFIFLFSKAPIRTQTDLQHTLFWARIFDPIALAFTSASGREPILLPIEKVLPALREDEVQTVYTSPLACIVYQWHTQVRYMTDLRLSAGVAVTLIDKRRFDKLSAEHQQLLRRVAHAYHDSLIAGIRQSNGEALEVLKDQGIEVVAVPHQEELKWRQVAVQVQDQFAGQLYGRELLAALRDSLENCRGKTAP